MNHYCQSIRNKPKVPTIAFSQGLIIPQDKPIILVIEDFDKLQTKNDQYNFSKILSRDENQTLKTYIHPKSIVIVSHKKGSNLDIKNAGFATWITIEKKVAEWGHSKLGCYY